MRIFFSSRLSGCEIQSKIILREPAEPPPVRAPRGSPRHVAAEAAGERRSADSHMTLMDKVFTARMNEYVLDGDAQFSKMQMRLYLLMLGVLFLVLQSLFTYLNLW